MIPLTELQRARLSTPAPGSEWQGLRTLALAYRDIPYNGGGGGGGLPCSPRQAAEAEAESAATLPDTSAPKLPTHAALLEDDLVLVALVGLQVLGGGGGAVYGEVWGAVGVLQGWSAREGWGSLLGRLLNCLQVGTASLCRKQWFLCMATNNLSPASSCARPLT